MYNKEVVWSEEQQEYCQATLDSQTGEVIEISPILDLLDDIAFDREYR